MKEELRGPERVEEPVYYKALRLVPPEAAIGLGVVTEAPVFVSARIYQNKQCDRCSQLFSPLVYQIGQSTSAQHIHEDNGGIYYYMPYPSYLDPSDLEGWYARVLPDGQRFGLHTYQRAEGVQVLGMHANCRMEYAHHELHVGVLMLDEDGSLVPVCQDHADDATDKLLPTLYSFKILDGYVLFTGSLRP